MKTKKYELELTDKQNLDIGGNNPTPLSVHEINGKLIMFVQLDEGYPGSFNIDVDITETEDQYTTKGEYIGTVVMLSGKEFHVFAKTNYIRADI